MLFSSNEDHAHPHIRLTKPYFVPNHISVMSGIPDLLQVCRRSRWVTLRTWKRVLLSFQDFGPQPWRIMVDWIDGQVAGITLFCPNYHVRECRYPPTLDQMGATMGFLNGILMKYWKVGLRVCGMQSLHIFYV